MSKVYGVHTSPNNFKNYFINSGFDIFQRTASQISTIQYNFNNQANDVYIPDRWKCAWNGTNGPLCWQGQPGNGPQGTASATQYCLSFQSQATSNVVNFLFYQRIESRLAQELASQTVSVSGWFRSTSGGPPSVSLSMNVANSLDNYGSVTGVSISNATLSIPQTSTWTYLVWNNITIPATAYNGLSVQFTSPNFNPSGSAQRWDATQLMLNIGPCASPYQLHSPNMQAELVACKRFYEKSYDRNIFAGTNGSQGGMMLYSFGSAINAGQTILTIRYEVEKRTAGTPIIYSYIGTVNRVGDGGGTDQANGSGGVNFQGVNGFRCYNNSGGAISSDALFHWVVDVEI